MKSYNIKALFFDIDGTLYDHKSAQIYALNKISEIIYKKFRISRGKFIKTYLKIAEKRNSANYSSPEIYNKEDIFLETLSLLKMGKSINKGFLYELKRYYYNYIFEKTIPYPDTYFTLKHLRQQGFVLGIITDGFRSIQLKRLKKLKIRTFFDIIVTSEDVGVNKPSLEIFWYAIEKIKAKPHEVFMIGDNLEKDIIGAKNVGMKTIWLAKNNKNSLKQNPSYAKYIDYIVKSLSEILFIVKK